jgi:hypothetical protein
MVHLEWQLSVLLWVHNRQGASWYYPPREHPGARSKRSTQTSLFRAVRERLGLHQGLQDGQRGQSSRRSVKLLLWWWWTDRRKQGMMTGCHFRLCQRCLILTYLNSPPPPSSFSAQIVQTVLILFDLQLHLQIILLQIWQMKKQTLSDLTQWSFSVFACPPFRPQPTNSPIKWRTGLR